LWFNTLPERISTGLELARVAFVAWLELQRQNFITNWNNITTDLDTWLTSLPDRITTGLTVAGTRIWEWLQQTWQNFVTWWDKMGKEAPESLLKGFEQTEPGMAEKIVTAIIAFIALVAITLIIGFLEAGRRMVVSMYNGFIEQLNTVIPKIHKAIDDFIESIKTKIENFKPKITIGLNLPDIEGAWNNLKSRAHNLGIPGFQVGGVVPGPIGAPVLATVHGGETISPNGRSGGSGEGSTFNVYVGMYAGTETEKRNIASDLYSALVQVAQSQNKTVFEYMGG